MIGLDDQVWHNEQVSAPVHPGTDWTRWNVLSRAGDRAKQVIVAPHGNTSADENPIYEQDAGDFLQPQPGSSDQSCGYVAKDRDHESGEQKPAHHHQNVFQPIQTSPFQVALAL